MKTKKLKLFVWKKFNPSYSSGLAFAIAHDEEEAKSLVTKNHQYEQLWSWGDVEIHSLNYRFAAAVSGGD